MWGLNTDMTKLLLILGLSLGLATQAAAFLKKPPRHPDPYSLISKGKVVAEWHVGLPRIIVASGVKMYICLFTKDNWEYSCLKIQPKTEKNKYLL